MSSSSRNEWHRRCLAATPHLTSTAWRLVGALDLCVLGFSKEADHLGEHLLRQEAQLDGRSFARARQELIDRGLLRWEPGTGGRGHRSLYELLVDGPETPAEERGITPTETPAQTPAQTPAPERGRIRNTEYGVTPHTPPVGGTDRASTAARRAGRFRSALSSGHQRMFLALDVGQQEEVAAAWQASTGLRYSRTLQAENWNLDPLGHDQPYTNAVGVPAGAGRVSERDYFTAWWLKHMGTDFSKYPPLPPLDADENPAITDDGASA